MTTAPDEKHQSRSRTEKRVGEFPDSPVRRYSCVFQQSESPVGYLNGDIWYMRREGIERDTIEENIAEKRGRPRLRRGRPRLRRGFDYMLRANDLQYLQRQRQYRTPSVHTVEVL